MGEAAHPGWWHRRFVRADLPPVFASSADEGHGMWISPRVSEEAVAAKIRSLRAIGHFSHGHRLRFSVAQGFPSFASPRSGQSGSDPFHVGGSSGVTRDPSCSCYASGDATLSNPVEQLSLDIDVFTCNIRSARRGGRWPVRDDAEHLRVEFVTNTAAFHCAPQDLRSR